METGYIDDDDIIKDSVLKNTPKVDELVDEEKGYVIEAMPIGDVSPEEYATKLKTASLEIQLDPNVPIEIGNINVTVIGGHDRSYTVSILENGEYTTPEVS